MIYVALYDLHMYCLIVMRFRTRCDIYSPIWHSIFENISDVSDISSSLINFPGRYTRYGSQLEHRCLRMCLYREWEICNSLMMRVQRRLHRSWGPWRVGFWRNRCKTWDYHLASSWRRRWWLFFLASRREAYWVRNASVTSSKLCRECRGRE